MAKDLELALIAVDLGPIGAVQVSQDEAFVVSLNFVPAGRSSVRFVTV